MPIRKRASKRRPDAVRDDEFDAIVAGLRGRPCPPDANEWMHYVAIHFGGRGRRIPPWSRVMAVFRTLSRRERREIVRARRIRRRAVERAEARRRYLASSRAQ